MTPLFDEVYTIWKNVSEAAVQKASGKLRAVIGEVRPNSIYMQEKEQISLNKEITELEELQVLPKLTLR